MSCPSTQTPIKLFHTDPVTVQSRNEDRKSAHISNIPYSTMPGKQREEPTDISILRKSWATDGPFPGGDKVQTFPFSAGEKLYLMSTLYVYTFKYMSAELMG